MASSSHLATSKPAKLLPKEHGAYAILAVPIVAAMIVVLPTVAGACIAIASVAGFFAHEPMLVVMGHRGKRAQRSTPTAKLRLVILLLIAFAAGAVAMFIGNTSVRLSLLACFLLAVVNFAISMVGHHRSLSGQLLGVVGLTSPSVAILLAAETNVSVALTVWAAWLVGFGATTMAVHGVIAAQKRQPRMLHSIVLATLSLSVGICAFLCIYSMLVTLPMLGLSWYFLIAPPAARYLKRSGWAILAGTVVTAILQVSAFIIH